MRKYLAVSLACAVMVCSQSAKAAPVSTQLTLTDDAEVDLFISTLGGAVTALLPFEIDGTIDVTLDMAISGPLGSPVDNTTGLSLDGAAISLSDQTLDLNLAFLGGVEGEIVDAEINQLSSDGIIPTTNTNPTNPFEYTFDPGGAGAGTDLAIDSGVLTYLGTGPVGGLLGSGTLDFASDPVSATLDSVGQIGLVTQDVVAQVGDTVTVNVIVSAPLTFMDTILTDPVTLDVDLSGALVATGFYTYIVPEPSTFVLLGVALLGLIPMWRRLRK